MVGVPGVPHHAADTAVSTRSTPCEYSEYPCEYSEYSQPAQWPVLCEPGLCAALVQRPCRSAPVSVHGLAGEHPCEYSEYPV
jgi:hypothetical protein